MNRAQTFEIVAESIGFTKVYEEIMGNPKESSICLKPEHEPLDMFFSKLHQKPPCNACCKAATGRRHSLHT